MAVKCTGEDRVLTAQVSGEVDHHGAREIMGERRLGALGGEVRVHNVPPQAARVLRAAGLDKLIRF